ncbi:MAG: DsrE family protein [Planctomycetes bacterium]|nr:DsrE family protein [Planctomycetota bacterium]MCB9918445.1 DsrE family protein [Planctomycetota bacterium]
MKKSVQVILTTGPSDVARAVLGLQAALAAVASGVDVDVFLTLDATEWACEPRDRVGGKEVYSLLDQLDCLGARITCCSACASEKCSQTQHDVCDLQLDEGGTTAVVTHSTVRLTGLATLMERVSSGVPTVTF